MFVLGFVRDRPVSRTEQVEPKREKEGKKRLCESNAQQNTHSNKIGCASGAAALSYECREDNQSALEYKIMFSDKYLIAPNAE